VVGAPLAVDDLFEPAARSAGYVDLVGDDGDPTGGHPGQRLMASRALPLVYERIWRPLGGRLLMGVMGPGMSGEQRIALAMLRPGPGDRVLDVACGPGNFTRAFARAAPGGQIVGLDASKTMLDRALAEGVPENVAYVRGDASSLPFPDESFDAVCCFAALYLIADPMRALDEIARVLAPGGRVAVMTSVNRGLVPSWATDAVVRRATGVRVFGRGEVTDALSDRGLEVGHQQVAGMAQFVSASRP